MNLKKSIAICMAENDLNQTSLAARMKAPTSHINRMMNKNVCSMVNLIALARVFNLKVSEFVAKGEV